MMFYVGGVSRNDLVVSIGLEAIVSLFFRRFYRVVCTRANSKREFRVVEIFCFTFPTYYVGIQICMRTSVYFLYLNSVLFRTIHYAILPFRYSAIPPFRHPAIPPFRHSTIPPFRHSAIPPFRSNTPFRHSAIPPFRHSAIPLQHAIT